MLGGAGLINRLPMRPFANALGTQYQTPLPDAHDLGAVRRRVGEIAPAFDQMRGFHFKLYGGNAPGADDAAPGAFAEYSSLYLWHGPAGANEFFTGGRFDGYARAFGRPTVRTWFVHAVVGNFAALAGATHFRRRLLPLPRLAPVGETLDGWGARLRRPAARLQVTGFDPANWEMLDLTAWAEQPPHVDGGHVYELAHVSLPPADANVSPA